MNLPKKLSLHEIAFWLNRKDPSEPFPADPFISTTLDLLISAVKKGELDAYDEAGLLLDASLVTSRTAKDAYINRGDFLHFMDMANPRVIKETPIYEGENCEGIKTYLGPIGLLQELYQEAKRFWDEGSDAFEEIHESLEEVNGNIFRKIDDVWTISYEGETIQQMKNLLGLKTIQYLIKLYQEDPDKDIYAEDLCHVIKGLPGGEPSLEYSKMTQDQLAGEGMSRKIRIDAEKARKAIDGNIRTALNAIQTKKYKEIFLHFKYSIKSQNHRYSYSPEAPTSWTL